ncbi:MAG: hypothetical protein IKG25_05755 [Mogibacterium sp.]|nr:hypothetical protein [Mogibacterium sp.]MBR4090399.1 hypothetical protein [Mogibacterium sp.]
MDTATFITTIIGSNGIFALITLLIQRHDSKKNGVKRISEQLAELYDKVDENAAVLARTHILRFSDELQNGIVHSQEYFRQQMDDCDTYDKYCDKHPEFKNSYTILAEQHIKTTYQHLLEKGEFKHDHD